MKVVPLIVPLVVSSRDPRWFSTIGIFSRDPAEAGKNNMKKKQLGQTLLEALIALATAVVIISAMTVIVLSSLNNAQFSRNQNQATQYAQQGIEFLKNLAQSDWASFKANTQVNYCLSPLSKLPAPAPPVAYAPPPRLGFFPELANLIQESVSLGKKEVSGLFSKLALIPQSFRSKKTPRREVAAVTSPTNLGYASIGANGVGSFNRMRVAKLNTILSTQEGVVSQGQMYLQGNIADATVYMVVYLDSSGVPGSLVAVSSGVLIPTTQPAGWVTFNFSPSFNVTAGQNLWLGLYVDGAGTIGTDSGPVRFAEVTAVGDYANVNYRLRDLGDALVPTPVPNPFGTSTDSTFVRSFSAYLIVNPPPTPTPTPTPTPAPTYTISGDVFVDTNNNGVKDGTEANYTASAITITSSPIGTVSAPCCTGAYTVSGVPNGSYSITLTVPSGYIISNGGLNPNTNPRTVVVSGANPVNNNFGIIVAPTPTPTPTPTTGPTPTPTPPSSCPSTGLIGYWKMDETSWNGAPGEVADSSGNGKSGTALSAATTVTGKFGRAGSFNTQDTKVQLSSAISLNLIPYSISVWSLFPLPTTVGGWRTLTRGTNDHQIIVDSSGLIGVFDNASATGFRSSAYNIVNDTSLLAGWHNIIAAVTGTSTNFYVDGIFKGAAPFKSNADIAYFGNYQGGTQNFGTIDDLRIYNYSLSSADISALQTCTPSTPPTPTPPPPTSTPTPTPPPPTPTPTQYHYLKITGFDGGITTFICNGSTIASASATTSVSLIDTSSVDASICYFTCSQNNIFSPPNIGINFSLTQKGNPQFFENKAKADFQTSVSVRNY